MNVRSLLCVLFALSALWPVAAEGYNLRNISKRDGLSNSAIQSICQDDNGVMWFGSVDGLNIYDGHSVRMFRPPNGASLPGNLIEQIVASPNGTVWIGANYGLARYDCKSGRMESFADYRSNYRLRTAASPELLFIDERSHFIYYEARSASLCTLPVEGLQPGSALDYASGGDGRLWIACRDGQIVLYDMRVGPDGALALGKPDPQRIAGRLLGCFHEADTLWLVDDSYTIYRYDLSERRKYYIDNIRAQAMRRGEISAIVSHGDNLLVGFKTGGLLRLRRTPETQIGYRQEETGIETGVFCLVRDRRQDVVWIGSDGKGVWAYYDYPWAIRSTLFDSFAGRIRKPVRCLLCDGEGSLWVGFKGDGLIRIADYAPGSAIDQRRVEYFTASEGRLLDNSVYCLTAGRRNVLWIGSDGGINYYSYPSRAMRRLAMPEEEQQISFVHGIYEESDTVLWIATVGRGVVRASIRRSGEEARCVRTERYTVRDDAEMSSNYFFAVHSQSDSLLWFGNRGHGALLVDPRTRRREQMLFDGCSGGNRTVNDIFCIHSDGEGNTYFGASYGLVRRSPQGCVEIFGEREGLPNNTVHGILGDSRGNLWVATNMGLARFDPRTRLFMAYGNHSPLEVIEYSDGAFFRDGSSGTLYFGGINGFTTITETDYRRSEFMPPLLVERLSIFGRESNLHDHLCSDDDGPFTLRLDHTQNFFSLSLSAIDHINGANYSWFYHLDGMGPAWIDNGPTGTINFTHLPSGSYMLHVKYRNRETGGESPVMRLRIEIAPPWYSSHTAYAVYGLLLLAGAWQTWRKTTENTRRRHQRTLEKMKADHQQEVYESKLSFFTNIAHEFCTPLTLICGPCNRILGHPGSDPFVLRYASLIERNASRLNELINELIEFRSVDTGGKQPQIGPVELSELVAGVAEGFNELAESSGFGYVKRIAPGIVWNTDREFLATTLVNLISNAFKYTESKGAVSLSAAVEGNILRIVVSNTGRGIAAGNLDRVFDRYSILDRFENRGERPSSRHGLGLAISSGMVRLLGGEIRVESVQGEHTDFIVELPPATPSPAPVTEAAEPPATGWGIAQRTPAAEFAAEPFFHEQHSIDKYRQTILIVDDEADMLWFICEIFSGEYNVIPVNSPSRVEQALLEVIPDAVICDVMMPGIDGVTLARRIKSDPRTAHVPLILISAKHSVEEQIEGLEAGAEMYISKPFNVDYLRTFVHRLISRKQTMREYFSSPMSAYDLSDGEPMHIDHRRFVQQILDVINSNITDSDLSVQFIAERLNMSARHLYRKIGEIGAQSPSEMIRECRMHVARDLLTNSNLTVDEIIYKSGFSNRSPFFKAFAEKYGCTPKEFRRRKLETSVKQKPKQS
ncbi:MAG: helix-turn-helix domain-containing protein [Rikenellaceae bacterium]|jgi:signal transduction histidine kinase/DNA-binding response OmpR family regulator/ligand-binding sensor domain-containing protein|nr:helix-turn-helix domain-containing protein [Rikenellaceae bacterium]